MGLCECGCGTTVNRRYVRGHNSGPFGHTTEERFWARVAKGDQCWQWVGAIKTGQNGGYGNFSS